MTYSIKVYDTEWKELEEIKLNEKIFSDENINVSLMHEFVVMQLSNSRKNIAKTKTRWEVASSGRKLYRQKGTGNARVGDAGSWIRRWGWVIFWPTWAENYIKNMPKKQRRKALFSALSVRVKDEDSLVLDSYNFVDIKTKNASNVLYNLKLTGKKVLLVISWNDEVIIKSFRNIPGVKVISANYVNPFDLLSHKKIVFMKDSLQKIEDTFLSK